MAPHAGHAEKDQFLILSWPFNAMSLLKLLVTDSETVRIVHDGDIDGTRDGAHFKELRRLAHVDDYAIGGGGGDGLLHLNEGLVLCW